MSTIWLVYYKLTGWIPRRLPESEEEFNELKQTLELYFGMEDSSLGWIHVASEVQNTSRWFLRKPYYVYANVVRKMNLNGLAENQKRLEGAKLQARLNELAEKVVNEPVPEGSHDSQTQMPSVQSNQEDLGAKIN